jgi:hypothetical protein
MLSVHFMFLRPIENAKKKKKLPLFLMILLSAAPFLHLLFPSIAKEIGKWQSQSRECTLDDGSTGSSLLRASASAFGPVATR